MDISSLLDFRFDLEKEYQRISKTLMSLGLSKYESRAYVALVAHGYGMADTIAQTAHIPRTSSYKALESLCEKGYALSTRGRPRIYKPEPPRKILKMVTEQFSEVFGELESIHEVLRGRGEPQLVYTITGKPRVLAKIGELLDTSQESFIISTPSFSEIRKSLTKNFARAAKRGVSIRVITEPLQRTLDGALVVRKRGLIATDAISDETRALIASPDLDACGFTDNPDLARHLKDFLEMLMRSKNSRS